MNRRRFIGRTVAGGAIFGVAGAPAQTQMRDNAQQAEVFIERDLDGRPHRGKAVRVWCGNRARNSAPDGGLTNADCVLPSLAVCPTTVAAYARHLSGRPTP